MKNLIVTLLLIVPVCVFAQQDVYAISSYLDEGMKAPNTHYIGEAWLNGVLEVEGDLNFHMTKATFKANSTLDWHKHASTQVLVYVDGEGYYQEKGKDPIILKAGDILKCEKDTEHWHSSTKESDVTYLAIYGGEQPTTWTEVVSQEYYDSVAEKLKE
ncbi:Acireductone dioxygenase [Arenibacter antarcticus]|mgnify:CR=1 FL=1|uniref:Cupin domain-containing protein n=1 Tax=Arenibacter antarcticus TaxID=2040469 RepID=A0ABW5VBG8_9FLAO|nr:cupin domain-containing protein [Arenibacter sp. H213]MCM4167570.1 cupin domain-containing protein [Arenibacter sp. H213]|tara:strand:+ start:996 stop:1469 length:474 start_codon:yes stop_codon:yes gene_type:complete